MHCVNAVDLSVTSEQSIMDGMDANIDSVEPAATPDLQPIDSSASEIDCKNAKSPSLLAQSQLSVKSIFVYIVRKRC